MPLGPLHFLCFIAAMNLILSLTFEMMPSFLCLDSSLLASPCPLFELGSGASCQGGWLELSRRRQLVSCPKVEVVTNVTAISCDLSGVSTWCPSFYPTVALYELLPVLPTLFCLDIRLVNKKKQGRKRQRIIARLPRPLALKLASDLEDADDAAIENSHLCRDWTCMKKTMQGIDDFLDSRNFQDVRKFCLGLSLLMPC